MYHEVMTRSDTHHAALSIYRSIHEEYDTLIAHNFFCCSNTTMAKEDKAKSPKVKKTKTKESNDSKEVEVEAVPYEVRMKAVTVISKPMADEKKVRCAC